MNLHEPRSGTAVPTEIVDTFDENFTFIRSMTRDAAHQEGAWHQAVHCWVVKLGDPPSVLFQLRSPRTTFFPNCLDITAAGHVCSGETKTAVLRELEEELLITPPYERLVDVGVKIDVGRCGDVINREFAHVFMLGSPQAATDYSPNPSEVAGLFEISVRDGLRLFSGEIDKLQSHGISWQPQVGAWRVDQVEVCRSDFVPRIDRYYLRVFLLAERFLQGEKHLAI